MAPAFWRCDSIVTDHWTEMRPALGGLPGQMVPVPCSRQRPCGNEYYEATSADGGDMQFCAICDSNGAIGRCANDHRMVCGYCSQMSAGRRLCNHCTAKIAAEAAEAEDCAKVAAEEASFTEVRAQLDRALDVLSSLGKVKDEVDRFLVLMLLSDQFRTHFSHFGGKMLDRIYQELRTSLVSAASALGQRRSALWDVTSDSPAGWKCNPRAIMEYWQRTGRGPRDDACTRLALISYEKRALRGVTKVKRQASGWRIGLGATHSSGRDLYVLTDWTTVATLANDREVQELKKGRPDLTLSHIHMLMKAGYVTPVNLPASLAISQLPWITIPWLPSGRA